LGRSPDQRMTLDSLARAQEALLEHLSLEKDPNADPNRTVRIELEFYRKDGSTVWLEHQVSGLRDANGTAIGLHGVARDVTERRKAEQTLKDSEAIYKRLFENTQTAMEVISGETGLVVLANETTAKMFGFDSADDLIGLDSMQYLLPEDRDRVATQMAQALADKTWSQGTELRVMTKDGRLLWINGLVTNTEYQGKPALLVSLIDLTARKQAEETLRSSEEKYRFLAEKTDDIIWTADLNLRTTYVSPSVQRVLGFTPEERLTQDPAHQMTPESITKAAEALAQHLALERDPKANPNRALRIELEYYRKDGSTVWLENQVTGIRDANGTLIGFHGVARDISERRRTERALRESEEKYRLLTENTNDMIWVAEIRDMNLRPTYVSSSVERILGFTPEEHLKRDLSQVIAPESLDRVMEALLAQLALEQDPEADPNRTATIEVQYNRRDGSTVWMENLISGIRDDNGTLVGLHGVARDVSDRKRVEKALNDRLKELQCIASISRLAERPELPIEDFVREAVSLLPPAWQYPEICGARIMLDSKEFKTADYRETQWSQSADIRVDEKRFGTVTVCYLKEMPEADEGPFLKEERDLINTVADFLGHVIQHRQMEQSLRASEERYRLLIDNAAEAIAVIQDGLVNFVNPKGAELVGRAGERMTPTPFLDYIHPDDRQMMIENHAKRLAGQEAPNNYTFRILDKEGNTRHIQINAVTLEWEGRPAVLAMLNDITDRVKVQEALIASERDYKNLFEQTMLGMEVIDGQTGKVLLANHAIARMFGFESPEEMVGLDGVTGWVMPEDMEWVLRGFAEAMADPEKRDVATLRIKGKDGRIVWVSGSGTLFDYEGRPAILISLVNVTAAKEAESKLHESEEKNRLLIDNAAEGIAVIQDGVAKFFNRRLVELTGWTAEELLTRSFLDLVHPDEREMIALNYMRRVAGDDVPNNYQFRIIDREGNTKWLQISAVQFNWEGKPATLDMFSEVTEQVKAEQALRDSEERFRSLVEKATDAVAVVDTAGNILYYTPSMERVTGYKPGEWISKSLSDLLLHRDDLPKLASVLEQVLKEPGAAVENFTTRYQHPDGTWHVLEATARNMLHDPKIGGVVANFRDITERVKAEQALKESEERYRLLADNSSDVIWVVDVNLKFTYVSPAVTRLLGYTVEEATAGSFIDRALTPDSLLSMTQALTEDLAGEERRPGSWRERVVEMEVVSKDGSKFWLEAAISGIRDSDGRLVGFQGACRNITDRKEAEELLRASEERFRGLVETTSDWVWEIDRNSRYTYVNPRVRDILGREPEEVLGHTPFEFMHQREGRRVSKIVRRFAAEHLPFSLLENTCVHKDGHAVVMETSAVPIIGSDGSFLGYRGIDRDITERKKAEQELQRSLKRLEKTMESTIEAITTTIETRDPYTTGHQMRVTELACAIAKVMEIPPTQIEGIRVAGLLHDIGKIAIPTEILSKPGKLNEVEYEMIKTHSKVGYNILKKIEFPWPVARAVLQHHERWNGSGYPHGIRGDDILLEARILAVADVMEAMSSHRPYRPSIGADKALDEISKNSGILYDPAVAQACITAFTQAGFKFAPSLPGVAADLEGTSASHPVQYLEDS
jgi:PAS domain S-box-containing protein/putative nucleotidyltransferase with HDIG domain